MKYVDPCDRTVLFGTGGLQAPIIYVIDLPYHPFEVGAAARDCVSTIVKVPVNEWDDSLTPWAAPGLYHGDADFKGEAAVTFEELLDEAVPAIERAEGLAPAKRAICGYSLGGLFALYAFVHSDRFSACGCLSGSVWYEGWVDHLRSLDLQRGGMRFFPSVRKRSTRVNRFCIPCRTTWRPALKFYVLKAARRISSSDPAVISTTPRNGSQPGSKRSMRF
mgnify:CR=1 FL=1